MSDEDKPQIQEGEKRPVLKLANPIRKGDVSQQVNGENEIPKAKPAEIHNATELEIQEANRRAQTAESERDKYMAQIQALEHSKNRTTVQLKSVEKEKSSLEKTNQTLGKKVKRWTAGALIGTIGALAIGSFGGYLTTYHLGKSHIEDSVREEEAKQYAQIIEKRENKFNNIIEGYEDRIQQLKKQIDNDEKQDELLQERYIENLAAATAKAQTAEAERDIAKEELEKLTSKVDGLTAKLEDVSESSNKTTANLEELLGQNEKLKTNNEDLEKKLADYDVKIDSIKDNLESAKEELAKNNELMEKYEEMVQYAGDSLMEMREEIKGIEVQMKEADSLPDYSPDNPESKETDRTQTKTLGDKIKADLKQYKKELDHDVGNLNESGPQAAFAGTRFFTHFPYCWKVTFTGKNADGDKVGFWGRTGHAFWSVFGLIPRAYEATAATLRPVKDTSVKPMPKALSYPVNELLGPITGESQAHRILSVFDSQKTEKDDGMYVEVKVVGKTIYKKGEHPRLRKLRERINKSLERMGYDSENKLSDEDKKRVKQYWENNPFSPLLENSDLKEFQRQNNPGKRTLKDSEKINDEMDELNQEYKAK